MVDVKALRAQMDADYESGKLYWRVAKKGVRKGAEAFTAAHNAGYKMGRVNGKGLLAHRVIWAMHYGYWPDGDIDHINGDRTDNRLCNLRLATRTQNNYNGGGRKAKASKYRGVTWHRASGKWMARCAQKYLGLFENEEQAAAAWNAAALLAAGEYARRNEI